MIRERKTAGGWLRFAFRVAEGDVIAGGVEMSIGCKPVQRNDF